MQINVVQRAPNSTASNNKEALEIDNATKRIAIVSEQAAILTVFGFMVFRM